MSLMQSPADFLRPAPLAWHALPIRQLQQEYAGGHIRPTDVLAHYISRIEQFNPRLKALIELDREGAWNAATIADRRFQQGNPRPLEGVVIGISATLAVRGLEHSAGMDARRRMVANEDAVVVARLRESGAIIVGTLVVDEGGVGTTGNNPYFGTCTNPHGERRSPGGAASGAAVAVSAGLCSAAIAIDTLGSARVPAAFTGLYALKPTFGAVSDQGMAPVSRRNDAICWMTRSMEDLDSVCDVLIEKDPVMGGRDARLIRLSDPDATECDIAVIDAYAAAAHLPEVMTLPYPLSRIARASQDLMIRDFMAVLVDLGQERCERLSPELTARIEENLTISDYDIGEARRMTESVIHKLVQTLDFSGVLVLPTTPRAAPRHGIKPDSSLYDFTTIASLAGLPAMTVPVGLDPQGMPVGVHLIGPARSEALLIREARRIDDHMKGYVAPPYYL